MNLHQQRVAGLILAAGASSRMGERLKLLMKKGGTSLIRYIVTEALGSALDLVVPVLGHGAKELKKELDPEPDNQRLNIIENKNWRTGISSSIIAGLRTIEDNYDHCMIILADMPFITREIINRLLHEYVISGLPLGAISVNARRSLPVIFSRELYDDIFQLEGDVGARDLFKKYSGSVCLVEPKEAYLDMDIDTPEDYERFISMSQVSR
jgi:molybdenum cofactor cytidylyltransferase